MPTDIVVIAGDMRLEGYLEDTPTGKALAGALPLIGSASRWGDEIYFQVPVVAELDDTARVAVNVGDLAYWPTGRALCIFFGMTPSSVPGEIRAASEVNFVGRLSGDPCCLQVINEGSQVRVEKK